MTTRCFDLEWRDTPLLVKADMQEHIEETLCQLGHEGESLLLCLLERVRCRRHPNLLQCICANALEPGSVLGIVPMQASVLCVCR